MRFKQMLVFAVISIITVIFSFLISNTTQPVNVTNYNGRIIKTVGHLEPNSSVRLISYDDESDSAYYELIPEYYPIDIGDSVSLVSGATCKVIDTSLTGFTISVSGNDAYKGMSGSPVVFNDEFVVGYVSSLIGKKNCFCIWR